MKGTITSKLTKTQQLCVNSSNERNLFSRQVMFDILHRKTLEKLTYREHFM